MADSNIEWTNKTWNPLAGCEKVSPGCAHCYAETMANRLKAMAEAEIAVGNDPGVKKHYLDVIDDKGRWNGNIKLIEEKLTEPLKWKKPVRVFVNSMSDLFHKDVPFEFIDRVFATMAIAKHHTFQVLTKRSDRMKEYFAEAIENGWDDLYMRWGAAAGCLLDGDWIHGLGKRLRAAIERFISISIGETCEDENELSPEEQSARDGPLPNVWLGVSVENQKAADERMPHLLRTPAAVRFLSCEPLLGPVDLRSWIGPHCTCYPGGGPCDEYNSNGRCSKTPPRIQWVIVGGESGHGARPCNIAWILSIVEQCRGARVKCFVKQLGASPNEWDSAADGLGGITGGGGQIPLALVDTKGGDPTEWPCDLRVRQFPA